MIYGLAERDEAMEMKARYYKMARTFAQIMDCDIWDVETLFDSENNIEVGDIMQNYVREFRSMPSWEEIYVEALCDFAADHDLEIEKDVSIYLNSALNTCIYAREELDEDVVRKMENLFNLEAEAM